MIIWGNYVSRFFVFVCAILESASQTSFQHFHDPTISTSTGGVVFSSNTINIWDENLSEPNSIIVSILK